jgi:hypothetical protein
MKIGLSFSRCIKDIFLGEVDYEDVLIIIARTRFNPNDDQEWEGIWSGYHHGGMWSHPEWNEIPDDKEGELRALACMLYNDGKLHQPRYFGAGVPRRPEIWLETVLPSRELEKNPAAKKAWDHFQVVAGLTKVDLNKDYG